MRIAFVINHYKKDLGSVSEWIAKSYTAHNIYVELLKLNCEFVVILGHE